MVHQDKYSVWKNYIFLSVIGHCLDDAREFGWEIPQGSK